MQLFLKFVKLLVGSKPLGPIETGISEPHNQI